MSNYHVLLFPKSNKSKLLPVNSIRKCTLRLMRTAVTQICACAQTDQGPRCPLTESMDTIEYIIDIGFADLSGYLLFVYARKTPFLS